MPFVLGLTWRAAVVFLLPLVAIWGMVMPLKVIAAATEGSFRVTETGAALYSIPLRVVPGTAGMEPKLALTYNSQSGNGLLGIGWGLDGHSQISRCPQTLAQDGIRGAVRFDWSDRYCLDGVRLMLQSGSYGGDGAMYRTERDTAAKIVSYGVAGNGPAWFVVWTKSGQVIEYGNTTDSRIEAHQVSTVRIWAVNKIADRNGNYVNFTYTEGAGEYRPATIEYGGSGLSASASVHFDYQAREDVVPLYQAGTFTQTSVRLSSITTREGPNPVRTYSLSYDLSAGTHRSRLTSIQECPASGTCLPALNTTWQEGSTAAFSIQSGGGDGGYIGYAPVLGDFNGDGYTDPSGYFKVFGIRITPKVVIAAVAAAVTYGAASSLMISSATSGFLAGGGLSTAFVTIGGEAAVFSGLGSALAGAAGGFAGGMIAGGDLRSGLYGAVGGGIGGALVGSGAFGEMVGGGVNGYLQTGSARGFARGFLAGAIPEDLGIQAYGQDPLANIGIGIARDGLRGGLIGGKDGISHGIAIGQGTNAVGHLVGATLSGFSAPAFVKGVGAFVYPRQYLANAGAITMGNVVSGSTDFLLSEIVGSGGRSVLEHEFAHIPQSRTLGALYLPVHAIMLSITSALPGGHHGPFNPFECSPSWISVPAGPSCR